MVAGLAFAAMVTPLEIVEAATMSGLAASTDGSLLAYRVERPSVGKNRAHMEWFVVNLGGGAPRRIGAGGEAQYNFAGALAPGTAAWAPNQARLYWIASIDGVQAIWQGMAGKAQLFASDAADIRDFQVSRDGFSLRYRVGAPRSAITAAEQDAYDNGVVVDATVDMTQPVAGGLMLNGRRVMQRLPGPWFERDRLLWKWPIETRTISAGIKSAGQADYDPWPERGKITASSQAFGQASVVAQGGIHKVTIERPDGTIITCTSPLCAEAPIGAIRWRPGHDELILFQRTPDQHSRIVRWRPGSPDKPAIFESAGIVDGGNQDSPACALTEIALACVEASAASPPRLVRITLDDWKVVPLDDPNRGLRSRIAISAVPLNWQDERGHRFSGQLLRSTRSAGPSPLVINYYLCDGFLKGGVGDEIPMIPLAEAGIAVLCITQSPDGPDDDPMGDYEIARSGIETIIARLSDQGLVDSRQVGMGGLSFGSEVTLWMLRHSRAIKAATLSSGHIEPAYYWMNALPGRGVPDMLKKYWKLGDPDSDPEGWNRISAARNIGPINQPLLMQLPEMEARYMMEFYARLLRAGHPAELIVYADEPHIKIQPRHKLAVYNRNLDWYRFWLKGEQDTDPAKTDQYRRWNLLARRPLSAEN